MTLTSLSEDSVHRTIDSVLASFPQDGDVLLRRTKTPSDWNSVLSFVDPKKRDGEEKYTRSTVSEPDVRTPFFFGIQAVSGETVVGFVTFYIAYSTWDGRFLYADQVNPESEGSLWLYRVMSKVATELGCARFTWKQKDRPEWNLEMADPEYLDDWIFLSMDRLAMANFVESLEIPSSSYLTNDQGREVSLKPLLFLHIEDTIREILEEQSMTRNEITVNLRLAEPDDTETIAGLVKGLAIYEKEPDAVNVTAEDYYNDGFNSSSEPLFYCILADVTSPGDDGEPKTTTAAMGLFYFGHDLMDGPFLYLEDLYCNEAYRKQGIGSEIMKHLAKISLALDCSKFTWVALDWNAPALSFYKKIGATMQTELKITRYCGGDIQSFAESKNR